MICSCSLSGTAACRNCRYNPYPTHHDYDYDSVTIVLNEDKGRKKSLKYGESNKSTLETLKEMRKLLDKQIIDLEEKLQDKGEE